MHRTMPFFHFQQKGDITNDCIQLSFELLTGDEHTTNTKGRNRSNN